MNITMKKWFKLYNNWANLIGIRLNILLMILIRTKIERWRRWLFWKMVLSIRVNGTFDSSPWREMVMEFKFIQVEHDTKDNGNIIWLKAMVDLSDQTVSSTLDSGTMTCNMEKALRSSSHTMPTTRGSSFMVTKKVKVKWKWVMVAPTLATSWTISSTEKDNTYGKARKSTTVTGLTTRWKVSALWYGVMDVGILVTTWMIRDMARVLWNCQIKLSMKEGGIKANKMALGCLQMNKDRSYTTNGQMGKRKMITGWPMQNTMKR